MREQNISFKWEKALPKVEIYFNEFNYRKTLTSLTYAASFLFLPRCRASQHSIFLKHMSLNSQYDLQYKQIWWRELVYILVWGKSTARIFSLEKWSDTNQTNDGLKFWYSIWKSLKNLTGNQRRRRRTLTHTQPWDC